MQEKYKLTEEYKLSEEKMNFSIKELEYDKKL
jgi:hypothetical protein